MKYIRFRRLSVTHFAFRCLIFVSAAYASWVFLVSMASPVALKMDVSITPHPALMRVTSQNHTHQQEMVQLQFLVVILHLWIRYDWHFVLESNLFYFQYKRFSSRLARLQTTCDKYNLTKGTHTFPLADSYEVCE